MRERGSAFSDRSYNKQKMSYSARGHSRPSHPLPSGQTGQTYSWPACRVSRGWSRPVTGRRGSPPPRPETTSPAFRTGRRSASGGSKTDSAALTASPMPPLTAALPVDQAEEMGVDGAAASAAYATNRAGAGLPLSVAKRWIGPSVRRIRKGAIRLVNGTVGRAGGIG